MPAAEVARELERGARMVILDARSTSDWLRGRIPGALPVPFYELSDIIEAPVHLFLFVKVRENWADDPERYREMGLEFPK